MQLPKAAVAHFWYIMFIITFSIIDLVEDLNMSENTCLGKKETIWSDFRHRLEVKGVKSKSTLKMCLSASSLQSTVIVSCEVIAADSSYCPSELTPTRIPVFPGDHDRTVRLHPGSLQTEGCRRTQASLHRPQGHQQVFGFHGWESTPPSIFSLQSEPSSWNLCYWSKVWKHLLLLYLYYFSHSRYKLKTSGIWQRYLD